MKMWNRILSMALCSAVAVSMLTACGKDAGTDNSGSTAVSTSGGGDGESSAAGAGSFKLGGIGPTTGDNAIYGLDVQHAIELAAEEINAAGGVNGYTFEVSFQDDESDAEKAVNAYNSLKDWGAQIIVGAVTTPSCIAVAEKTKDDNMFQITPSSTSVESTQYPNVFRVCFSDPNQGIKSAQYIGSKKLASKVAVIYDSSSVYSSGIYENFAGEAAKQDFEIVSAEAFTSDNKTDFTVQLQKAKDEGAELIFLPIYYNEASMILSQAKNMGYAPAFFGGDGMDGILDMENFNISLAEGVMLLTPFAADATDAQTVNFVTSFKEKYGNVPNQFAADAYDAVYAVKASIEKSGATPDMSVSDLCEALKSAMVQISIDGLTGEGITWTEDGEPNKAPKAVVIKNGIYTAMD